MKLFLFVLFLPFLAFADQIVVIGDSITAGWSVKKEENYVYLLQQSLDVKVVSCGVGGMHSGGGYSILSCLYDSFYPDAFNPSIAVLTLGINDVVRINPEQTLKAFELFIDLALEHGCIPVVGRINASFLYPAIPLQKINQLNKVFIDLKLKYNVLMFDFLTPKIMNDPNNHIGDKVHPSANGHKIIAENLEKVIRPLLEKA